MKYCLSNSTWNEFLYCFIVMDNSVKKMWKVLHTIDMMMIVFRLLIFYIGAISWTISYQNAFPTNISFAYLEADIWKKQFIRFYEKVLQSRHVPFQTNKRLYYNLKTLLQLKQVVSPTLERSAYSSHLPWDFMCLTYLSLKRTWSQASIIRPHYYTWEPSLFPSATIASIFHDFYGSPQRRHILFKYIFLLSDFFIASSFQHIISTVSYFTVFMMLSSYLILSVCWSMLDMEHLFAKKEV